MSIETDVEYKNREKAETFEMYKLLRRNVDDSILCNI